MPTEQNSRTPEEAKVVPKVFRVFLRHGSGGRLVPACPSPELLQLNIRDSTRHITS